MYGLKFRNELPAAVAKEFDAFLSTLKAWVAVDHNEDGTHNLRPSGFDFVPIGAYMDWPTDTPPSRWLICDGSAVSRTTYQALFAVVGTTFGAGDGSTTFNLPDFRGRFPLAKAASGTGNAIGGSGGSIDHTHTVSITSGSSGGHDHSGATGSGGSHTHTYSGTTSFDTQTPQLRDADLLNVSSPCEPHSHTYSGTTSSDGSHTHTINNVADHNHSVSGTSGTGNPPYLVFGNKIILTGVE
jgi:microcystin-dependent protein